jgi:hypothetical protein
VLLDTEPLQRNGVDILLDLALSSTRSKQSLLLYFFE